MSEEIPPPPNRDIAWLAEPPINLASGLLSSGLITPATPTKPRNFFQSNNRTSTPTTDKLPKRPSTHMRSRAFPSVLKDNSSSQSVPVPRTISTRPQTAQHFASPAKLDEDHFNQIRVEKLIQNTSRQFSDKKDATLLLQSFQETKAEYNSKPPIGQDPVGYAEAFSVSLDKIFLIWNKAIVSIRCFSEDHAQLLYEIKKFIHNRIKLFPDNLKTYIQQIEFLQKKVNANKTASDEMERTIVSRNSEISVLEAKAIDLQALIDELETRIQVAAEKYDDLYMEKEKVQDQLVTMTHKYATTEQQLAQANENIEKITQEANNYKTQAKAQERLISDYEANGASFQPKYLQAIEDNNNLTAEITELKKQMENMVPKQITTDVEVQTDYVEIKQIDIPIPKKMKKAKKSKIESSTSRSALPLPKKKDKKDNKLSPFETEINQSGNNSSFSSTTQLNNITKSISTETSDDAAPEPNTLRPLNSTTNTARNTSRHSNNKNNRLDHNKNNRLDHNDNDNNRTVDKNDKNTNENNVNKADKNDEKNVTNNDENNDINGDKNNHESNHESNHENNDKNVDEHTDKNNDNEANEGEKEHKPAHKENLLEQRARENFDKQNEVSLPEDYHIPPVDEVIFISSLVSCLNRLYPLNDLTLMQEAPNTFLESVRKSQVRPYFWVIQTIVQFFNSVDSIQDISNVHITVNELFKSHLHTKCQIESITTKTFNDIVHFCQYYKIDSEICSFFLEFILFEFSILDFRFFSILFHLCFTLLYPDASTLIENPDTSPIQPQFLIHKELAYKAMNTLFPHLDPSTLKLELIVEETHDTPSPFLVSFFAFARQMIRLFRYTHIQFHHQVANLLTLVGWDEVGQISSTILRDFFIIITPTITQEKLANYWERFKMNLNLNHVDVVNQSVFISFCSDFPEVVDSIFLLTYQPNFSKIYRALPGTLEQMIKYLKRKFVSLILNIWKELPKELIRQTEKYVIGMRNAILMLNSGNALSFFRQFLQYLDLKFTEQKPFIVIDDDLSDEDSKNLKKSLEMREYLAKLQLITSNDKTNEDEEEIIHLLKSSESPIYTQEKDNQKAQPDQNSETQDPNSTKNDQTQDPNSTKNDRTVQSPQPNQNNDNQDPSSTTNNEKP